MYIKRYTKVQKWKKCQKDRQIGDKRKQMKVKNCVYLKSLYKQQKAKIMLRKKENKRKQKVRKAQK